MFLSASYILLSVIVAEPIAPTGRTRYPYWQMVNDVVTQIESGPPRQPSINKGLHTPGEEYPFESFRHLQAADLIRAAKEGIIVARQQEGMGKPKAEVDQEVLRNVTVALEYLPMVLREDIDNPNREVQERDIHGFPKDKPSESDTLFSLISNREEDPVLRRFLMERSVPGFAQDSLLTRALPLYLASRDKKIREVLIGIASHPGEVPELQILAMKLYMHYMLDAYQSIFDADPNVQARAAEGTSLPYTAAVDDAALKLSTATQNGLKQMSSRINDLIVAIAGHISENSTRSELVKDAVKSLLTETRDTIYNVDKSAIDSYLAGEVPEPEMTWPVMPATPSEAPPAAADGMIPVLLPEDGGPPVF